MMNVNADEEHVNGYRIGVQWQSPSSAYAANYLPNAEVYEYDTIDIAVEALKQGDVDFVLGYLSTLKFYEADDENLDVVNTFDHEEFGIGVAPGESDLLAAIDVALGEVIDSGEYDEIFATTFGDEIIVLTDDTTEYTATEYPVEPSGALAAALDAGTIAFGADPYYPPFESYDDDGNWVGFDVDMADAIATRIGAAYDNSDFTATMVEKTWDELLAFGYDNYDATLSAMIKTEERAENTDFSRSYYSSAQGILVTEGSPTITWVDDLNDFICDSGEIIPPEWVNDGDNDCGDWSDEDDGYFVCDNGEMIPEYYVNDGYDDCGDGSDEEEGDYFVCDNGETIPMDWVNDGWDDCGDGSDETGTQVWDCRLQVNPSILSELDEDSYNEEVSSALGSPPVWPGWCGEEVPSPLELDGSEPNLPPDGDLYAWYDEYEEQIMARSADHIWYSKASDTGNYYQSESDCTNDGGDVWESSVNMCGWNIWWIEDDIDSTLIYWEDDAGSSGWFRYEWVADDYLFIGTPEILANEGGDPDEDFVCDNGETIPMDWYDDGWDDCGDGSDEPNGVDSGDDEDDELGFGFPTGQLGMLLDEMEESGHEETLVITFVTPQMAEVEVTSRFDMDEEMSDTLREDIILATIMADVEAYFVEGKPEIEATYASGDVDVEETLEAYVSLYENATASAVPGYSMEDADIFEGFNTVESIREQTEFDDMEITQSHLDTYYDVAWSNGMNNMLTMDMTLTFVFYLALIAAFSGEEVNEEQLNATMETMVRSSVTECPEAMDGFGVMSCVMEKLDVASMELFGGNMFEDESDANDFDDYCLDNDNMVLNEAVTGGGCSSSDKGVFYDAGEHDTRMAIDGMNSIDAIGLMNEPGGLPIFWPEMTAFVNTENILGAFSDNAGKSASIEIGMTFMAFFPGVEAGDSHLFVFEPEEGFEPDIQVSPPAGYSMENEPDSMTWNFTRSVDVEVDEAGLPGPGLLVVLLTILGVASVRRRS